MKKLLAILMLLGPPATAQYAHTSNPGVIGNPKPTLTNANFIAGSCVFVASGGSNSAMFAVTGTWTGTLGFFGTNDGGATTLALQAYAVSPTTGAVATSSVNTTTGNGVWLADSWGTYQTEICATAAMTGTATLQLDAMPAVAVQQVTGLGGGPVAITGSISVSGAADVVSTGAPTTFNANAVCTGALLTAGLQSAGFHFDVGTLIGTFTAQCSSFTSGTTNFTNGNLKDVTGASVTGAVTNPNAQTDWTIICPGDTRRVQVCTTAFTSGSTTGQAVGTFYQTASAAGGGGGGPATQSTAGTIGQSWFIQITDTTNGPAAVKAASTAAVAADKALVCAISPNNTVASTESGTWTIQPGNTANTTPWLESISQGGNTAVVKPASTAPLATDPALVVALSPNSSITTGAPADTTGTNTTLSTACATGVSCAGTSIATVAATGQQTITATITASTSPVGVNMVADCALDGTNRKLSGSPGTSGLVGFLLNNTVVYVINNPVINSQYTLIPTPDCFGATLYQVRVATLTSVTTLSAQLRATAKTTGELNFISGQQLKLGQQTAANSLPMVLSPEQGPLPLSILAAGGTQQTPVTLTTTTETAVSIGLGGGLFTDLTEFDCTNGGSTITRVDLRDTTGGTVRKSWWLGVSGGGLSKPISPSAPARSQTAGTGVSTTVGAWTVQLSAAPTGNDVRCNVTVQQRVP